MMVTIMTETGMKMVMTMTVTACADGWMAELEKLMPTAKARY